MRTFFRTLLAGRMVPGLPRRSIAGPGTSRRARRARAAILLLPIGCFFILLASWVAVEAVRPEVIDPDHYQRRGQLQARMAENPGRPLAVVIGSSRLAMGFAPESLPDPARPVLWSNQSRYGAGPVMNGLILARLLDAGIRPDLIVFEVMPVFCASENDAFLSRQITHRDLMRIHRHSPPGELDLNYLRNRVTRVRDLARVTDPFEGLIPPTPYGGSVILMEDATPAEREAKFAFQRKSLEHLAKNVAFRPVAERALLWTLEECRKQGITAILLLAPEGPVFRSLYDPAKYTVFEQHIAAIAQEQSVRLIDARNWLPESDFMDSHHPLRRGAVAFTKRLVAEVGFEK